MWDFFFYLDLELFAKIKKDLVSPLLFYIFIKKSYFTKQYF